MSTRGGIMTNEKAPKLKDFLTLSKKEISIVILGGGLFNLLLWGLFKAGLSNNYLIQYSFLPFLLFLLCAVCFRTIKILVKYGKDQNQK